MHAARNKAAIPVTMTLMDSEGYVTSRLHTGHIPKGDIDAGKIVMSASDVVTMHLDKLIENRDMERNTCRKPVELNTNLIARLEFFHDELVKCNSECKNWKSEFEKLTVAIKRLTRNQTYEVRLLQKAIISCQQTKKLGRPAEIYLEEHSKLLVERNNLIEESAQRAKELVEMKTKLMYMQRRTKNIDFDGISSSEDASDEISDNKPLLLDREICNDKKVILTTSSGVLHAKFFVSNNQVDKFSMTDIPIYDEPINISRRNSSQSVQYIQSFGNEIL